MIEKKKTYKGEIESFPRHDIYLNVNNLEKGAYTLRILNRNKVIKKISFDKL